jgi:hypothetical protein
MLFSTIAFGTNAFRSNSGFLFSVSFGATVFSIASCFHYEKKKTAIDILLKK